MKICVIGAGIAGLVSAKYCSEFGHEVTVFEQTKHFGGCWHYTDKTGVDEHGLPIQSAMYKYLKTNLPKEIMPLEGLKFPDFEESYITQEQVLDYIKDYVQKFDLIPHIKFCHHVVKVVPEENNRWSVTVTELTRKTQETHFFDAIMVCNGHYFKGKFPKISGMEFFSGTQMHSHDYREPETYAGKVILVVGAGPSGVDIAKHTATTGKRIFVSRRSNSAWEIPKSHRITVKPEVESFTATGCRFKDGTYEDVDVVVYCTGYEFSFPFFEDRCGIEVDKNWVKHLYRHVVNIKYPTMGLIGLFFGVSVFPIVDLQARYFLASLSGKFNLPSHEEMKKDEETEQTLRTSLGWPLRYSHKSPDHGEKLTNEMAEEAGLKKIPEVFFELHRYISKHRCTDFRYKIIDDQNFVKTK